MTRSSMLEILGYYIRTARSKGLSERIVIYKHAFEMQYPVVTIIGLQTGIFLQARSLLRMSSIPRVGRLVSRPLVRDLPTVQELCCHRHIDSYYPFGPILLMHTRSTDSV
jgi:peptide/nickel transport system permease protein